MDKCLKVASGHFEKNCLILNIIKIIPQCHKQLFENMFSQIYPKYSDQIASEPFMDNCQKVASGHFEKLFYIEYHQNHRVS